METIDYKDLLLKYIAWINESENSDYVSSTPYRISKDFFTVDEWEELNILVRE